MNEITLNWNEYTEAAINTAAEGIVMLENKDNVLPLKKGSRIALFGRMQIHYYKSGTGSGGMVNVNHVSDIREGLNGTKKIPSMQVSAGARRHGNKPRCLYRRSSQRLSLHATIQRSSSSQEQQVRTETTPQKRAHIS